VLRLCRGTIWQIPGSSRNIVPFVSYASVSAGFGVRFTLSFVKGGSTPLFRACPEASNSCSGGLPKWPLGSCRGAPDYLSEGLSL